MLLTNLQLALRNIRRNKGFFALNFGGLFVSLVSAILIGLLIFHERSFDNFHPNADRMYRVFNHSKDQASEDDSPVTPYPLANAIRQDMAGMATVTQIHYADETTVEIGERRFLEKQVMFADSQFFKVLGFRVSSGDPAKALAKPGGVLLTESTAKRYFGSTDPLGQHFKLSGKIDLEVQGILPDLPSNTHLPFCMVVSFPSLTPDFIGGLPLDQWGVNANGFVYVSLPEGVQTTEVEKGLQAIADKNINQKEKGSTSSYLLQPLRTIHFDQRFAQSNPAYTTDTRQLYVLGAIGFFLLLVACVNYVNLSTAIAVRKAKEVGVRKTLGAGRWQLAWQFMSETAVVTAIVIIGAAATVPLFLPMLNAFLERNIPLQWVNAQSALLLLGLWAATALLAGFYPSLVLSGFNPVQALKSKLGTAQSGASLNLRRGLVVFQFLVAQVFIIGVIVAASQMKFIRSKPLGFNREAVLDIGLEDVNSELQQQFRTKLSQLPDVLAVSFSLGAPTSGNNFNTNFNLREKFATEKMEINVKLADVHFKDVYGIELAAGRWFGPGDEAKVQKPVPDSLREYVAILNETAVKKLGFASPEEALGKYVQLGLNDLAMPVIGVVKDFHIQSLHEPVSPVLMMQFPFFYYNTGIKLSKDASSQSLAAIEDVYKSVYPNTLFDYKFLDDHVASLYRQEDRTFSLFQLFTFISLFINALGLIGLVAFLVEQKTKEIGIRKVLGASTAGIVALLSKDFLKLVVASLVIASPLAYYFMKKWLENFAYRIDIQWWVFVAAGLAAVGLAFLTVSFQSVKAALANPVKSLRSE